MNYSNVCAEVDFVEEDKVPSGCYVIVGDIPPSDKVMKRRNLIVAN
jgi:hypothetical protein